ncbi:MAG: Ig-like domain-containing protein [Ignavibacteriae bacterium]|nr:Ig-like domain-containing protein [Ignavibacteriota bacterium]
MFKKSSYPFRAAFVLVTLTLFLLAILVFPGCTEETIISEIDDLSNPNIQPRVIFTLPSNNGVGPFDLFNRGDNYNKPHFVIRFNKLMNTLSFESDMIKVEGFDRPVVVDLFPFFFYRDPEIRSTSSSSSIYDDVLAFSIRDSLSYQRLSYQVGHTYTVEVEPGLSDINGNTLLGRYQFSFNAEPYFRVLETYPEENDESVSPSSQISIIFNSHVDTSIFPSLQLSPQIEGKWTILSFDLSTVLFRQLQLLPFNTTFTLTVDGNAKDIYGHQIHQAFSSSFKVPAFGVSFNSPENGQVNVELDRSISFSFNSYIDTGTVRNAFTLSPTVQGDFSIASHNFWFTPFIGFSPRTIYTVTLTTALRASDGTSLPAPYSFSFTTGEFRVTSTSPSDGDLNVFRANNINAWFNAKIDTSSVRNAFTINPSVGGTFILYDNSGYFAFDPSLQLSNNTIYTVTISTALRSKHGYNLSSPYTFAFRTSP